MRHSLIRTVTRFGVRKRVLSRKQGGCRAGIENIAAVTGMGVIKCDVVTVFHIAVHLFCKSGCDARMIDNETAGADFQRGIFAFSIG